MADIEVRQGSTHSPLRVIAFTDAGRVNFPAEFPGGVTFRMVGAVTINGTATGDADGNLSYQWQTHDLDAAGTYAAVFRGTDGSGRIETFPRARNLTVIVVPAL